VPLLRDLISAVKENPDITCGAILERWRDTEHGPHLTKLANLPMQFEDEEQMQIIFHDTINFFHKRQIDQQIQTLLDVASQRKLDEGESKELTQLLNISQA
jgi:DNA primase